ncbi:hypothetical protein LSTR_LSTR009817 [Laodelphax striatellus]|uniref:RING-type domain-containing protein n=1 Tax=Laodelphax striatellus TaxID=195883 RepID=A0A482WI11_LAOST|nr:hypothetical protein LSTR_LSTR009817 [Laodelphax striatellus]
MLNLSKTLQEDIRINQINLKAAIQNHQALVVKLREGNLTDPSDVKLKLAGIQKHILSLGGAQKILVARVKKELAAKSNAWSNHTTDKAERPNAELRVYPSANCIDPARKFNATYQKRAIKEAKTDGGGGDEDVDRKRNQDGSGGGAPPNKRLKTILQSSSRPTSPVLDANNYDQSTLPSSSDDSQESLTIDTSSEPSKVDFLSAVGLVNREQLMLAKSNGSARRRRRHAGHHSQYSSHGHWDLTVELMDAAAEVEEEEEDDGDGEQEPVKREPDSAASCSGGSSPSGAAPTAAPSPPPPAPSLSPDKIVCTVCRKKGILSVCDICGTAFHWFCLDKDNKQCPVCLVSQVSRERGSPVPFHHKEPGGADNKWPPLENARYYKRVSGHDTANHYNERLKVKKSLEARNESLKHELAGLKRKATELSAALVSQTENIKKLTAGEERTNEKVKKILDIINFFKAAPS